MSSADEHDSAPVAKKRKLQRACDYCRRKKIKCDGPQMPNNRCSKCIARKTECTYVEGMHKSSYPSSYVENLEGRLERMEKLVSKLLPDKDVSTELESHQSDRDTVPLTPAWDQPRASTSQLDGMSPPSALSVTPMTPGSDDYDPSDDDDEVNKGITEGIRRLSVSPQPYRYHGKSSGLMFIRTAMSLQNTLTGKRTQSPQTPGARYPWLKLTVEDQLPLFDDFPQDDLLHTLVELYFRKTNDQLPLLHEPTFKNAIQDGLHRKDGGFGAIVLLVCAIGSRFVRDPRVLLDGCDLPESAGWKWYEQVEAVRRPHLAPAQLYDIQIYALIVMFLQGTTVPQVAWMPIGFGIRIAIDVGAHRRKMYSATPTVEEELWRRAFWILLLHEWTSSYGLGRPSSIHDEDIDLALPTECDDEYWTTPEGDSLFKQPPGKPSKVSFFNCLIRLTQILAFSSRTIYSINKSRTHFEHGDLQWEQRIVAEMDSALNKWLDSLPSHLHWDPDRVDTLFLNQSATLFANYYQFQIAVHRPFMTSSRRDSPLSFPSVIICTNAARSSVQVLEALYKRTGNPYHRNMGQIFMCGIVLMMNVWAQRRSGQSVNVDKDLEYVKKCMEMLKALRFEMHASLSLRDVLNDLMSAANASVAPQSSSREDTGRPTFGSGSTSQDVPPADTQEDPLTTERSMLHPPVFAPSQWSPPFGSDDPGLTAMEDFSLSIDGMIQHNPFQQNFSPSSPAIAFPAPSSPTRQSRQGILPAESVQSRVAGPSGFSLGGGPMFGLEPLGYSESVSALSSGDANPAANDPGRYLSETGVGLQGDTETAAPDFAFIDDTLTMWSNVPTSFGWDDWGAYLNDVNNQGT